MIFNYEREILNFIRQVIPNLKQAVYSEKEEILEMMFKSIEYPSFYYMRTTEPYPLAKFIPVQETSNGTVTKFYPYLVTYRGTVLLEKQHELQLLMNKLRFYWNENPYMNVKWPNEDENLSVALRLLYIKLEEVRNNKDDKGALRYLEFGWQSQLFLSDEKDYKTFKSVNLTINGDIETILNVAP